MSEVMIRRANYLNHSDAKALSVLLNAYAIDKMGGGVPLPKYVQENIASELAKLPYAFSLLGFVDGVAAGLVNCFEAFSTFNCRPLINIHDIVVLNEHRGHGLSQKMLAKVEEIAIQKNCCKITLEVLQGNIAAKHAYKKFGFNAYALDPAAGHSEFWQKLLP